MTVRADRTTPLKRQKGLEISSEASRKPVFVLLILLLAASGSAALIYEVVWFQLLQLVIGSTAVSLGLLLAAYMGGLCLGSILLARCVGRTHHPLKVYGFLEIGIGILGLLVLFSVPVVGRLYLSGGAQGLLGIILRGLVAGLCLLPPTALMGASLPALARWLEATPRGVSWFGYLYSANIAGAVVGCVLAGFYLLRVHDMAIATYAAAAINVAVGLASLLLATRTPHSASSTVSESDKQRSPYWPIVYVGIALSGLCSLGAQVVWTRLLSLLLGGTVYTFSIILAVFLLGLWAGSAAGAAISRRTQHARLAFAACQVLAAAAIGWTSYTMAHSLPFWPVDPWLSISPWFNFELDLVRCVWAIFPATLLWGASFPLALAAVSGGNDDPGRISGEVYAANTAGAIVGALAFSLLVIPSWGTVGAQQVLIGVSILTAVLAAAPVGKVRLSGIGFVAAATTAVAFGAFLVATMSDVPWQVIAYGRRGRAHRSCGRLVQSARCHESPLPWRGTQFVASDCGESRTATFLRQREGGSLHRSTRHAPRTHDGPCSCDDSSKSKDSSCRRIRGWGDGGFVYSLSGSRETHHLRTRTPYPACFQ